MEEDTKQLKELVSQQQAIKLLDPLIKACGNAQENHRAIEREVLRNGFGLRSGGIAKDLYEKFKDAVGKTKGTEFADAPWRLVRDIAISVNNKSRSSKAAAAIIEGLIEYFTTYRPTSEMVEALEQDKRTTGKNVIQQELDATVKSRRWKAAIPLTDRLLTIETDTDEAAALKKVRETIAGKRRSQVIARWGWAAAAVIFLAIAAANQNNHPTYPSGPQYSSPAPGVSSSVPAPRSLPNGAASNTSATPTIVRPPAGTDLEFTPANLRYCAFQNVMLETARPLVTTETQHSAFNASVEDWNSRCGSYQYRRVRQIRDRWGSCRSESDT